MSSLAGLRGEAGMSGYVATKWAVRGLTKAAALDLARYGIRVNSIHPGVVRTPLSAEGPQVSMSHVAMNRIGEPIEIANLTVFLASDESSFSTGAEFIADGGETAGLIRQVGSPAEHAVSAGEVTDHVRPFQWARGDGRSSSGHHGFLRVCQPRTRRQSCSDHGCIPDGDIAVVLQRRCHAPFPPAAPDRGRTAASHMAPSNTPLMSRFSDVPEGTSVQKGNIVTSDGREASFVVGEALEQDGMRVFAGLVSDPFFMDVEAALRTDISGKLSFDTAANTVQFRDVLSIVVEVPFAPIVERFDGVTLVGAIAENIVTRRGKPIRIERLGRPEIKNFVLANPMRDPRTKGVELRDLYNKEDAFALSKEYRSLYESRLDANLAFFDGLDGKTAWPLATRRAPSVTRSAHRRFFDPRSRASIRARKLSRDRTLANQQSTARDRGRSLAR